MPDQWHIENSEFRIPNSEFKNLSSVLDVLKIKGFDIFEILFDFFGTRYNFTVARQQPLHIQIHQPFDAFFEQGTITAGKIRATDPFLEDKITGKQRFLRRQYRVTEPGE